jgi:hypothetical protein
MRSAMPRCGCGKLAMYANTGSSPVAVFASLALPVIATSSFAEVLPWALFLPSRLATRFFDLLLDDLLLDLIILSLLRLAHLCIAPFPRVPRPFDFAQGKLLRFVQGRVTMRPAQTLVRFYTATRPFSAYAKDGAPAAVVASAV